MGRQQKRNFDWVEKNKSSEMQQNGNGGRRRPKVSFESIEEDQKVDMTRYSNFIGFEKPEQSRSEQKGKRTAKEEPRVETIYPLPREYLNIFHLIIEFLYEFMRGVRLVDVKYLDACEGGFAQYMIDLDHTLDYIKDARKAFDYDEVREGIFQIFDDF